MKKSKKWLYDDEPGADEAKRTHSMIGVRKRANNERPMTEDQCEYFKNSVARSVAYVGLRGEPFHVFTPSDNGFGYYFSDSEEVARSYSKNGTIAEVFLNITNPLVIEADGGLWSELPEPKDYRWEVPLTTWKSAEWAKEKGYDGVIIKNVQDCGVFGTVENRVATTYAVFNSDQIKLTSNEHPTSSPDIRK